MGERLCSSDFDFDEWSALARTDAAAFDRRREELIERSIERSFSVGQARQRLHGLQCRIDLERMRAHTPLKACLRLSSLMWESFYEMKDSLNKPMVSVVDACSSGKPMVSAPVLPFRKHPD